MKSVRVDGVVISAAALELAISRADRSEAFELIGELTAVGVGVTVWERFPRRARWWREAVRTNSEPSPPGSGSDAEAGVGDIVAIGLTEDDLPLRDTASIYLHLGDKGELHPRVGVSIPLFDQGVAGLLNGIRWALKAVDGIDLVQMGDLTDHARRCAAGYRSPSKPADVEQVAREMAASLRASFVDIEGVLGTGFPFYCVDAAHDRASRRYPVPESIRHFTATQADFFASKLAPPDLGPDTQITIAGLRTRGSDPGQSEFNAYEYTRWGASPPVPPARGRLQDFFAANALEPVERLWPCDICTAVHDPAKFPRQAWIRDFMQSCVDCHQTAFLPRAIGVLGSDIDLIVVADVSPPERAELAASIGEWVDGHPDAYRHDTHWSRQLWSESGPLDVFTVAQVDFWDAMDTLSSGRRWEEVTVPCDVGWLPITHIDYEIGKYFPLCVELLEAPDEAFRRRLAAARASFAGAVGPAEVLDVYSSDSFYLQQLASNATIRELLESRNRRWSGAPSET